MWGSRVSGFGASNYKNAAITCKFIPCQIVRRFSSAKAFAMSKEDDESRLRWVPFEVKARQQLEPYIKNSCHRTDLSKRSKPSQKLVVVNSHEHLVSIDIFSRLKEALTRDTSLGELHGSTYISRCTRMHGGDPIASSVAVSDRLPNAIGSSVHGMGQAAHSDTSTMP